MAVKPPPTLQEIHDAVSQLSLSLFAIHDLAQPCEDADNVQFRIGALVGMLAEHCDHIYGMLAEHIHDATHPEEEPHV